MRFFLVNGLLTFKSLCFTWSLGKFLFCVSCQGWSCIFTIIPLEIIVDHYVGKLCFSKLALAVRHLRLDRPFAFWHWTCDYFGDLLFYCTLQWHISLFLSHAHRLYLLISYDFTGKVNLILTSIWYNFTAFKYFLEDVKGWTYCERLPLLIYVIVIFLLSDNL